MEPVDETLGASFPHLMAEAVHRLCRPVLAVQTNFQKLGWEKDLMLLRGNLLGIQHLGLPVTNLERSKAFYLNFGFSEVMRTDLPKSPEPVRVAMVQKDDFTIELYQLSGAEREALAARSDGHIDHVALNVRDIDQAYAEISAAGFEILEQDAPVFLPFWTHGVKFFTIRGPDGEKVEFNQILK